MTKEINIRFSTPNIRITREKPYYMSHMQTFANHMADKFSDTISVDYGKQDTRGGISITLFNTRHCVDHQHHFNSKDEMLGFIVGYNKSFNNYFI